jgi:arsenite methyltransferase
VIDLGSGSGMDAFAAAQLVGSSGRVLGVDFTVEQLANACRIATAGGFAQVELVEGRIENVPAEREGADWVISNGGINLSPDKERVLAEAARVLRPGRPTRRRRHRHRAAVDRGDRQQCRPVGLLHRRRCPAGLLSSCDRGRRHARRGSPPNHYEFISDQARNASSKYGVKSASVLAVKPRQATRAHLPSRPSTSR